MTEAREVEKEEDASSAARGSSFNVAMRILPPARRKAMLEIYHFCRAVDDIADAAGPAQGRTQALDRWRRDIGDLYASIERCREVQQHLRGLKAAIEAFDLQRADFCAIIDGVAMDVGEGLKAPDLATLDLYCDRVASAVGRLSVRAFGMGEQEGLALAHHLGRAFQLTNILRDLDEDAALGRLYLPREDLCAAGITQTEPQEVLASPLLSLACAPTLARAKAHFAQGFDIMAQCPRQCVRAPRIMADVYYSILKRLAKRGFAPPRARIEASRLRAALAVFRYGLI